jgi:hypothetical protein
MTTRRKPRRQGPPKKSELATRKHDDGQDEDRRGQTAFKVSPSRRYIPTIVCMQCALFVAGFKTLKYLDTRILSLMSGCINLIWVFAVFIPMVVTNATPIGFLYRLVWGAPYQYIIPVVAALGVCEIWSAITNSYRGRLVCSMLSMFWWTWLTTMAFIGPTNESAAWMFAVITFFRSWTFVTINHTHPEGKHHGQPRLPS